MPRRRRHSAHEEHENSERWLLTYADMITLLLALFMMLYAMSVLDLKKFQAFQESFKTGMGKHVHALPGQGDPPNGQLSSQNPGDPKVKKMPMATKEVASKGQETVTTKEDVQQFAKQVQQAIDKAGLQQEVTVRTDKRGITVAVHTAALFPSGEAKITPTGVRIMSVLGPLMDAVTNPLAIEGHTDNVPIHTAQFPSNWELSTGRAVTVLHYLISKFHVPPGRLSAAGYADTHPLKPNTSEANRQQNRRVEIVVVAPTDGNFGDAAANAPPANSAQSTQSTQSSPSTQSTAKTTAKTKSAKKG